MKRSFNGRGLLCAGTLLSLEWRGSSCSKASSDDFSSSFTLHSVVKWDDPFCLTWLHHTQPNVNGHLFGRFTIIYLLRNLLGEPILTLFPQMGFAASINCKVKRLKLVSQVVWYWNHSFPDSLATISLLVRSSPVSFVNIGDKQPWLVHPQSKLRSLISYIRYYGLM